jgi:hypothetical protein
LSLNRQSRTCSTELLPGAVLLLLLLLLLLPLLLLLLLLQLLSATTPTPLPSIHTQDSLVAPADAACTTPATQFVTLKLLAPDSVAAAVV